MRDREQEYPRHQPGRGERNHHDPFILDTQAEGDVEESRRRPVHQRETATTPQLPPGYARKSLIIGAIIGILVALQGIILTLVNADVYRQAAKYINDANSMPLSIATHVFGIAVLSLAISAVLYFLGGLIIGRVAVHRRWAFIGGFVGGLINWVIGAILKWIPSYPDAGNTGFSGGALGLSGGIVAALIGVLLLGFLAGLLSLLGAWLTTRRHPYYVGYAG